MTVRQGQNSQVVTHGHAPSTIADRENVAVSFITVGGRTSVLSRFGDVVWSFVGGPTNVPEHMKKLDFGHVPEPFINDTKSVLYHYISEGRVGRKIPTVVTARYALRNLGTFFEFLCFRGVESLDRVSEEDCDAYINHLRQKVTKRGRRLTALGIEKRLSAVELLSEIGEVVGVTMVRPWPGTSAKTLAGSPSQAGGRISKTPVIPEEILRVLFQSAVKCLANASALLDLRDGVTSIRGRPRKNDRHYANLYLKGRGWGGGIPALEAALVDLLTACYIIVATLSGCRNHEIAHLKSGACFGTRADDGSTTWWFKSKSTKTGIGTCEWMVPRLVVDALEVMERWAKPLQDELEREIAKRREQGSSDLLLAQAERHRKALFVCRAESGVRTMEAASIRSKLVAFALKRGVAWPLATHQFRRTFAVMAAKSSFGDLRYLKEHFKHWSMDMTLLYAAGGFQDKELLDEVADELQEIQLGVTSSWLDPETKLAGGASRRIKRFRETHPVQMYSSRAVMVEMLSGEVNLRSNGHAWCTADDGASCLGATSIESTRCVGCANSVIGVEHADFYANMRKDLDELLEVEDIGPSGRARVMRDIARCESVLMSLGLDSGE